MVQGEETFPSSLLRWVSCSDHINSVSSSTIGSSILIPVGFLCQRMNSFQGSGRGLGHLFFSLANRTLAPTQGEAYTAGSTFCFPSFWLHKGTCFSIFLTGKKSDRALSTSLILICGKGKLWCRKTNQRYLRLKLILEQEILL